jgi:drug/metabolite transporter (DMT)-like permease
MDVRGSARCLLAAVLFGASAPLASKLAGSIPSLTLAGLLYLGAAMAVAPSAVRRPPSRHDVAGDWKLALLAVVFGGAVGPALLVMGLAHTGAASASILLNTELVATVILAALLFREHLGGRVVAGTLLITAGGALLTWQSGVGVDVGAVLIVAACACWGLDNCVTARIDHLSPEHVVALKGVVAGGANLLLGLSFRGLGPSTDLRDVAIALLIGAAGYGLSITLWVKGARDLGAARGQLIFATAPFLGAAVAWIALREPVLGRQVAALTLAAAGVAVSLRSAHEHEHEHHPLEHDHEHTHDDGHHDHQHADGFQGRHSHPHRHRPLVHAHPHVPDLHHRHDHH